MSIYGVETDACIIQTRYNIQLMNNADRYLEASAEGAGHILLRPFRADFATCVSRKSIRTRSRVRVRLKMQFRNEVNQFE